MSRQLTVTVILSGTCPESWEPISAQDIKLRAEQVIEDTCRKVFNRMPVLVVNATATVEGGSHD